MEISVVTIGVTPDGQLGLPQGWVLIPTCNSSGNCIRAAITLRELTYILTLLYRLTYNIKNNTLIHPLTVVSGAPADDGGRLSHKGVKVLVCQISVGEADGQDVLGEGGRARQLQEGHVVVEPMSPEEWVGLDLTHSEGGKEGERGEKRKAKKLRMEQLVPTHSDEVGKNGVQEGERK